jgi:pimeloyl-ACP methyl ester carboxylesterase
VLQVNSSLYVEEHGSGGPVLLLHGWPGGSFSRTPSLSGATCALLTPGSNSKSSS